MAMVITQNHKEHNIPMIFVVFYDAEYNVRMLHSRQR